MPTVRYKGFEITCETAQEAADVIARLQAEDAKKIRVQTASPLVNRLANLAEIFGPVETHWKRDLFWKFVEALGEPQKEILTLLVKKRKVTDQEIRRTLKLDSNKQLAGFLSGISKQAGAHNIPARAVFTIENESQSGEITKSYVIATDFLTMAIDQNWPTD